MRPQNEAAAEQEKQGREAAAEQEKQGRSVFQV